jgi:hypothetical protein
MSSTRGPQPSSVYRRRRLAVLLGAVAVLVGIVLIIIRPTEPATPAPAPTPSSPTVPAAEPVAPSVLPAPTGPPPCAPGQVQVTPVTDVESYGEGQLPQLSWTLVNLGAAECVIDVGTGHQVFTVTSGSDVIWTSTDCQTGATDTPYTLPPGPEAVPVVSTPIQWERVRSSPDTCDLTERPQVPAGGATYSLSVSVGGVTSTQPRQFLLY